ncbi:MAG: DUF5682 family protein [Saprospiraceae bacterium]|nr:DUF5682 family protein [Saprospiraceae bacterium]
MLKTFGIRHHGPGSAKSLKKALQNYEPDCIIIEAPADAEGVVPYIENEGLKPPVSILIYNPKDLSQGSYIPFAEFSPEWQAMKYAVKNDIPIRFMDLPMYFQYSLDRAAKENTQIAIETKRMTAEEKSFRRDPIGFIAKLAGYSDSERWWEITFEQNENEAEIFEAILQMMTALRNDEAHKESISNLRREAFMRKIIRKAVKEGFEKIAVICGAWHSPVLENFIKYKQTADNAILKGLKRTSTKATWVPWSYDRLTFQSGYGAGVISPAWYALLFQNRKDVTMRWMVKVARLFRKEDMDASAAHAIEAVRLAKTLATLRGLSIPGIDEMKEAAISIFGNGDSAKMDLIEQKLIIGKAVGKVPSEIPVIPLQQDLLKTIKSARLSAYWENTEELWLKANANNPQGGIDLREEKDLMKSHLLHRLNLLKINWGKNFVDNNRFGVVKGSFKEKWKMKWKPDFSIKIIEAGMWGNTLLEASNNFIQKRVAELESLPELTALVEQSLNANLTDSIDLLIQKLQDLSALTTDVYNLMDALPNLVKIIRYGNTRQTDVKAVKEVVHQIIPRICIGLLGACVSLDEEASKEAFDKIIRTNQSINTLNNPLYNAHWFSALKSVSVSNQVNGILSGACTRILFDKNILDIKTASDQMSFELSKGGKVLHSAYWIEGFLNGSGLLLIHKPELWNIIDNWMDNLKSDDFKDILPLLRRTFSQFQKSEKEQMLTLAKRGQVIENQNLVDIEMDLDRAESVLPTVHILLGTA